MMNNPVYSSSKKALVALLAAFVAAGPALAQDVVKANNTDDLNLTSSWSGGSVPGASNVAVWDNTSASGSFLLGDDLEFQGIRIGNPGGLVTISDGNTLTLGSSGIDVGSRNLNIVPQILLSASQQWTIGTDRFLDSNTLATSDGVMVDNQGHDLTINVVGVGQRTSNYANLSDLAGSGDLIKDGSGRVRFTGFNSSFTGNIIMNDGVLHAGFRDSALGSGASTLTLNGGQLTFASNTAITNYGRNTTVGGNAVIYNNNSTNNGARNYVFGTLSLGEHTLTVNRNAAGTTAGNITFGATTLTGNGTFEVGDHGTDAAALNQLTLGAVGETGGARDLVKTGGGTLILTGSNSYSGLTDVQAGTLELGISADLAGTSGILLANGATLDVSALAGGLTLGNGQSLGGAGTVVGDLVFGSGATFDFNPTQTLTVDGALSFDNTFGVDSLNVADWSLVGDGWYTLINNDGDFSNITNWGVGNAATLADGRQAYFQEGSLQLVVIPEPSTLVLLGVALLSAAVFRKRRG